MSLRVQSAIFLGVMVLLLVPASIAGASTKTEAGYTHVEDTVLQGKSTVSASSSVVQKVEQQASAVNTVNSVKTFGSTTAISGEIAGERTGTLVSKKVSHGRAPAQDRAESTPKELKPKKVEDLQRTKPASGGTIVPQGRELKIAREDIVAHPVGRISKEKYKELYKESAKRYGFGSDWYVLAAVGWVESRHGEDMGPSTSGAMGPMQFLPSTWKTSGVDGNHDGVKNIMDPRDAIPAAARYLKRGGAPKDWFAALYTYNHSEQYVKDVLGTAERYRRLAKDYRVGPYE